MFSANRSTCCLVMAAAVGFSAAAARAADPTNAQLLDKVQQLEAKVAALQDQTASNASVTQAIQQVMADADHQAQMLAATNASVVWDSQKGLWFQSDDGAFSMHPGVLMQFQAVENYRGNLSTPAGGTPSEKFRPGNDNELSTEVHRVNLDLNGNIYGPDMMYAVQVTDVRGSGTLFLNDAYFNWRLASGQPYWLKVGQFKDPAWHEGNVDDGMQLAGERSLANGLLGSGLLGAGAISDRITGVSFIVDNGGVGRGQIALHDGYATGGAKFPLLPFFGVPARDFGISGRVEWILMGNPADAWSQYQQFSARGAKSDMLIVGGGFDCTQASSNNAIFHTIDAQWENTQGLGVYAALLGNYDAVRSVAAIPRGDYYNAGGLIQAGWAINNSWEPFVRYDYSALQRKMYAGILGAINKPIVHEFTFGVNYYLHDQNVKFTADLSYLPNGAPFDMDGLGVLANDGHNELIMRGQVQIKI